MAKNWQEAQVKEKAFWERVYLKKENDIESYTPITLQRAIDFTKKTLSRHNLKPEQLEDKTIADIGCGPYGIILGLDNILNSVKPSNSKIIGADPLMNFYRSEIGLLQEKPGLSLFQAQAEELPIEDESCNFVFCVNVLDHVDNPEASIRELHRITKTNGNCGISLHVVTSFFAPISPLLKYVDTNHPHHLTTQKVTHTLQKYFSDVQVSYSASMIEDHPEFSFGYIFSAQDKVRSIKRWMSTLILKTVYFNCSKN